MSSIMIAHDTSANKLTPIEVESGSLKITHADLDKLAAIKTATEATSVAALSIQTATQATSTALAGTISVASAAISVSETQIWSSASVAASSSLESSSVDISAVKSCAIYGNCSSGYGDLEVQLSYDNTNFYTSSNYYNLNSSGDFAIEVESSAKYIRLEKQNTSGSSEILNAYVSIKS